MSLRRSARNAASAKIAASEATEALYQKADTNGTPMKTTSDGIADRADHYPELSKHGQKMLDAKRNAAALGENATTSKKITAPTKTAAPKKAAGSKKRKAPDPSPALLTNVANPVEIFTIPPGHLPIPDPSAGADAPSTPLPAKRRRKADTVSPAKPVPFTPTPSGVGLIAGSKNVARKARDAEHILDDMASVNRPAEPHATNAPVLTPNGDGVVVHDSPARKRKANVLPPDVGSPLKPVNSTTDTLLKDAEAYLVGVDETGKLEKLIRNHHCKMFNPEGLREVVDPFTALASGIMGQQVSGAAAASIRRKFTALFPSTHPSFPSPSAVLILDIPKLRTAGLSQRKAEYITGLAEKFASGEFTAEGLVSASDEELIEKLVAVRGLGRWSVEMFACFGLKRMDVFSTGDLGVQRGMAAYMGRDVSKLKNKGGKWKYMSEQEMLSIASRFSPYRSLFMWYMWRIADVETEVLE